MSAPVPEGPSLARVDELLLSVLEAGSHVHPAIAATVREAHDELVAFERARQRQMLDAVRADLGDIDVSRVRGGRTYERTALWLAEVIDKRGADDGPSTTAKLADQLTKVMGALTQRGDDGEDDGFHRFTESISEPVIQR